VFILIYCIENQLKGIVHPKKKKNLFLLTLMLFQTRMSFFLMMNIEEDVLKNAGYRTVGGPH